MPIHTDHIIANSDLFKLRSQKNTNHEVHVSIGDLSDSGLIIKTLNDVLTDGPSTGGLDIVMTTTDAITSSNSTHEIFLNNAYGELSLSTDGITQGEAFISLTATTADVNTALGFMNLNPTSAGIGNSNTGQIQFNSTYNFFRDHLASPAGLQYYADYSANYTTRSLVDKAYVDALVTAQDLDFQADSGGPLSIDLDSETLTLTGGTGIDTTGLANDVSFAIDSTVVTLTGSQILTNKTLTSPVINTAISGTAFLDEDNMASDSETKVASQQSIKAYVDTEVAALENFAADDLQFTGNRTHDTFGYDLRMTTDTGLYAESLLIFTPTLFTSGVVTTLVRLRATQRFLIVE
jgi:hypothetical protein